MLTVQTLTQLELLVTQIAEAAKKPGVMSLAGQQAEARCRKHLKLYFKVLGARVKLAHLEKLAGLSKEAARSAAEYKLRQIVRRASDVLHRVLKVNYHEALLVADRQVVVTEADSPATVGPASGLLSADAEAYAAEQAAKQIVGINQTTVESISELVANAVGNQFTPAQLSRDIRDLLADMTKNRSDLIARTEMADAFGEAAIRKLVREQIEYKQLILSPDACEVCQSIEDNGPVPVDEPFVDDEGEEYDRSPIHPACRCATVGARAPIEEAGVDDEPRNERGEWTVSGDRVLIKAPSDLSLKDMTSHVRNRLKTVGVRAKVSMVPGGGNSIRINTTTFEGEFTGREQEKILHVVKANKFTLSRGFEINTDQKTYSKGGHFEYHPKD